MHNSFTLSCGSAALAAVLITLATPCAAQVDDPDTAADAIYVEAKRLYAEGNFMRACPKFNAVHKIDPGVGSALYLGDCFEKEGKLASAREAFADAVRIAKKNGDKRVEIASVRLAGVAALVGKLTIEVPNDLPDNAVIDLDEHEIDPSEYGKPIPLNEGPHVVVFRAPGYLTSKVAKEIKDGSSSTLKLAPLLEDPEAAWQISPMQVAGIIVGGLGIGGMIAGGVLGASAISTNDEFETHCNGQASNLCRASGTQLFDEASDLATASTVAFIAGGVLLAGGITLVIVGNEGLTNPEQAKRLELKVSPVGLTVGGSF